MKRKATYLLLFVCFSVLVSSAGRLESKCEYTTCIKKKSKDIVADKKAAASSNEFSFPFNSVFSLW